MIGKVFIPHVSKALEHTLYATITAAPLVFTIPQTIVGTYLLCDMVYRSVTGQRSDNQFITENSDHILKFFPQGMQGRKAEVALDLMVNTALVCVMGSLSLVFGKLACNNVARVYESLRKI